MNGRKKSAVRTVVAITGLAIMSTSAAGAETGLLVVETVPSVDGIIANVPALTHPLPAGWQPTLFWWQAPLSFDNPSKLKKELQALSARGMLPTIDLCPEYAAIPGYANVSNLVATSIAQARAVAKAGFPVHLSMKAALDLYRLPDGKTVCHADSPDAGKKDAVGNEFPCLLLKDGWTARAAHIRGVLQQFAAAKVRVAGVWYDYEGYPHVWNGMTDHIARCPSCQKAFKEIPALQKDPKTLPPLSDGFDLWVGWAADFWAEAVAAGLAKPVREVFPKAKIGFYGFTVSSADYPTGGGGLNPAEIDVVQPVCYAQPINFANNYFKPKGEALRYDMERAYFLGLVGGISGVVKNMRPNQTLMPYVCGYCDGNETIPRMSRTLYREFLRHAILRGVKGFYCFNTAPPYTPVSYYYTELADINVVYNEFFAHRAFLEGGETLNHDWLTPVTPVTEGGDWRQPSNTNTWSRGANINGVRVWLPTPKVKDVSVWSGLRKGDQALIRVMALADAPTFLDVTPFPGVTVRLLASPAGMTYVVDKTGAIRAVE